MAGGRRQKKDEHAHELAEGLGLGLGLDEPANELSEGVKHAQVREGALWRARVRVRVRGRG